MEFISLSETLNAIAETIKLDPHLASLAEFKDKAFQSAVDNFWRKNNPRIEWARQRAIAAQCLNEALHHPKGELPQWMEYDQNKRFAVKNDDIEAEAIRLLTYLTGWGGNLLEKCSDHIRNASNGWQADLLDNDIIGDQIDPSIHAEMRIRFDRAELIQFLDANGIKHKLRENAEAIIKGWYDEVMGAKYWLGISKLSPKEAAMLLCQYNPNE